MKKVITGGFLFLGGIAGVISIIVTVVMNSMDSTVIKKRSCGNVQHNQRKRRTLTYEFLSEPLNPLRFFVRSCFV